MNRTINLDGRDVQFRASAGIPRLYRLKFHRDIIVDMKKIAQAVQENSEDESNIPLEALTLFEDVAYLMAKHADKDKVPNSVEEWLDGFDTFSIYAVFPVIRELWEENLRQLNIPQKK